MEKKERFFTSLICIFYVCVIIVTLGGCGNQTTQNETQVEQGSASIADESNAEDLYIQGKKEVHYTGRDLSGEYNNGTEIKLSESYTITQEGVYIFSGTLNDGQIIVDTDDQAKVQIVLAGVTLTCQNGPGIYVKSADKVFITLANETENMISDGSSYTSNLIAEDEPWGAIFSKDDLTINGGGTLNVNGNYLHGIVSKDSLKVTGGTISVTAAEDGMRGNDEICIHEGNITIVCKLDGLKSNNDEDEDCGNVSIDGGTVSINGATSQGIDAYNIAQIIGGTVNITTENEGIQGEKIYIEEGQINIDAVDDCLNAKDSLIEDTEVNHENALLEIAGGNLILSTSSGDGLDSNGSILITGGKTVVHGSSDGVEVALDYNGSGTITGGIVYATGSNGMAQNFDDSSSQCSLMYDCSGSSGTSILMYDTNGNEVVSFKSQNSFSSLIISTPELSVGKKYTLKVEGSEADVELSETITNYSGFGMGPGGMHSRPDVLSKSDDIW